MKYFATSLLSAAVLAGQADAKTWQLQNGFVVEFFHDTCDMMIKKRVDNGYRTIFESDDQLVRAGHGDVDDIKIMAAGNVINFPKASTVSERITCESFDADDHAAHLKGSIVMNSDLSIPYSVDFSIWGDSRIDINASAPDAYNQEDGTNFFSMRFKSAMDEEIYGMGLQYSDWDFKGKQVPLIVDEAGVGRGVQPITAFENDVAGGQGGTDTTSYAPAATFITSNHRAFTFNSTNIGIADFSDAFNTELLYWHADSIEATLMTGDSPLDLARQVSSTVGKMQALPEWIQQGAIVGVVGGQDFVDEQYAKMKENDLPMVGIWMQDWSGEKKFPEGTRVLWNWQLNTSWYYDWDNMVSEWAQDGCRPFIYINPYIADLSDDPTIRNHLFQEGVDGGYFVKNSDGEPYLVQSISIQFAQVDFTNPDAWNWYKDVIKYNMVQEASGAGWMHDFGEYLPFDAVLFDGSDPVVYHNQYPADWARLVKEALEEVEGGDEIIPFMRAGTSTSPKDTRLFWMGDQLVTWDRQDGLESAMVGLINAAVSGFTIGHSDIGGYTSTEVPHVISYVRSKELLWRWIEMNAFSDPIMRSHPSNLPDDNYQIYDEVDTIQHMAKFTRIHMDLAGVKMDLMKEAEELGTPMTRPLLLHFPHDKRARQESTQFMLGDSIMMAPIFKEGHTSRDVYLPGPATWTHWFTGESWNVDSEGIRLLDLEAPLGQPAVFKRSDYQNIKVVAE